MPIRMVLTKILCLFCLLLPLSAWAGQASELVAADSSTRADLIAQWAANPTPELLKLLQALQDGNLLGDANGKAYLQTDAGVVDAESGKIVKIDADTLDAVPLNNRLRTELDVALAITKMTSPDLAIRTAAVQTLLDAANPALLPQVEKQLAVENNASLKALMGRLVARMQLAHPDPAVRLKAVTALASSSDPSVKSRIEPLTKPESEPNPAVRAAASKALQAIQHRLMWQEFTGYAFSGLSLGSILLLAALGLAITYGLLGVINMAHGELLMIGAYSTFAVQGMFRHYLPGWVDWYLPAALPVAFLVTGLVGIALERLVIRHLYGRPLETLLATWGISLFLIQTIRVMFGAQNVEVANPSWMSGGWEVTAALTLPYNRIIIIGFAFAVLALTWLLLNKTRLGLFVRAVTQNRRMADCVGVPTGRVDMLAFGLGSGIAGLAGVALSQIGNVGPDLGQTYIIDSFMVVVLGGVGQLAGSVIAALGLGVVGKILEPSIGAVLGKIIILVFIILFIQKRPMGLFALKGRSVE
ncbi:MAG: urea ABC transporter permease subunit UrtB [Formivibrio sp.]|nr:urea ABC transporter permease subunit UrtB [Formivibrio sp.]